MKAGAVKEFLLREREEGERNFTVELDGATTVTLKTTSPPLYVRFHTSLTQKR